VTGKRARDTEMAEILGLLLFGLVCFVGWIATGPDPRTKAGDRRGREH
jgi:hypothetical protein